MREILFRGKNEYTGWVYGDLRNYEKTGAKAIFRYDFLHRVQVDPKTVGQFTGLTDKNGKKVFEWDIGRYKQTDGVKRNGKAIVCTGKVIYNAKTASYAVESKDETGCKYFDYFPIKDFEVIGNIHDNPELLEVDKDA